MNGNAPVVDKQAIKLVCEKFLVNTGYRRPDIQTANEPLVSAMRDVMYTKKIECPELERIIQLSANLIHFICYECTLQEKLSVALINWFAIYADKLSVTNNEPYIEFSRRLFNGQAQLDPVLDALNYAMITLFDSFDTPVANNIIASVVNFIPATFIESQITHNKLTVATGAIRFAQFLRHRSGLGLAFALFPFSKSKGIEMKDYICAVPEMDFWICGTNDLLSYYKEAVDGEMDNYIMARAMAEGKDSLRVLTELEQELQTSRDTIYKLLSPSPSATRSWRIYEEGYIMWHMEQHDKYKLNELGF